MAGLPTVCASGNESIGSTTSEEPSHSHDPNENKVLSTGSVMNKYASLCCLNVCGLRKKLNDGILEEYIRNLDIIGLTETKTDELNNNLIPKDFAYNYIQRKVKQM